MTQNTRLSHFTTLTYYQPHTTTPTYYSRVPRTQKRTKIIIVGDFQVRPPGKDNFKLEGHT